MLKKMRLQNFKAWQDTGEIRLAPITVFFGNNSSGKSSIHQLLMMLKQTARSSDRTQVLDPGDGRGLVELGTFRDMIHRHDSALALKFELGWDLVTPLRVEDGKNSKKYSVRSLCFSAEVAETGKLPGQVGLQSMTYHACSPSEPEFRIGLRPSEKEAGKYDLQASGYDATRQVGRGWGVGRPVHFYGFPGEAVAYYQNMEFLPDLALEMERLLDSVHYLGPLREHPKRTYVFSGAAPEHVGEKGEYWLPAFLSAVDRQFKPRNRGRYKSLSSLVEEWAVTLGLMKSFRARPLSENGKEYQVDISTNDNWPAVRLPDVGFGVSQVLPVIVECFYVPRCSTIVLEQPEIHLHPAVQASLADLFIEAIGMKERGGDRNLQIIIESHSEHFLRRLQRRIAEQVITEDDAALYFCKPGADGSTIEPLELDKYGYIANWPENFFGDAPGDLIEMTKAGLKRRIKEGL